MLGQQPDPARRLAPGEPRFYSHWRPLPDGAWFNPIAAHNAAAFFPKYCRLTKKEWAGRPFALELWQRDWIIRQAFGWMRADGTRLYRRVIVWVPRKNGKTELMAGVSHLCLLGDGLPGAECYAIATSGDQSEIVFKAAKDMVTYCPELSEQYEVFEDSLFVRATRGLFEPLTGKARGKHGLGTTYLLGDEVHEWADDRLYTYVRNAMASAAEPLEMLISTAGIEEGYGVALWEESVGICEGTFDDPETLVAIWCAPQDPKADLDIEDPVVWAEANPNLGISLKYDYMVKAAREAVQSTARENDFKRYHLNIWVGQNERWLPMPLWNACNLGDVHRWRDIERDMAGRKCFGGLDLASTKDFNALVWVFPPEDGETHYTLLPRFWWPKESLKLAVRTSRVPFESWEKIGALTATPGNAADHDAIIERVLKDAELFQILGLGIDRFNAHSVAVKLIEAGVPVELVAFGMLSMSGPSKMLERLVLEGNLDHGAHPVLRWMAANTAIRRDGSENYMPCKKGSANKIDGIAGTVMGFAMALKTVPEDQSYLTSSPLLILSN